MKFFSGLLAGVLLTTAVSVSAQSLGELAKKEQERRKAAPPAAAVKTYTNDDLKKLPPAPGSTTEKGDKDAKDAMKAADSSDAAADSKGAAAKGDAAKDTTKPAEPAKDEAYWHGRITSAREELRRNEMFRDALQARINGLTTDFTARDDPYQRAQIADDRQKALAELTRVNTEITNGGKQIAAIEDEARRAGVPPGWIR
jgi:hypothetical protein